MLFTPTRPLSANRIDFFISSHLISSSVRHHSRTLVPYRTQSLSQFAKDVATTGRAGWRKGSEPEPVNHSFGKSPDDSPRLPKALRVEVVAILDVEVVPNVVYGLAAVGTGTAEIRRKGLFCHVNGIIPDESPDGQKAADVEIFPFCRRPPSIVFMGGIQKGVSLTV